MTTITAVKTLTDLETRLNAMVREGKMLEALDEFYAADCEFQEGTETPRVGRQIQSEHLSSFFSTLKSFNGATLHSQCIGDDVATAEWTFDMEGPDGPIVWNEILRRIWKHGKVVNERYYTAS